VVEVYPHTKLDGNRKNFLWTYGRTHLSSNLLGHRRGDDLTSWQLLYDEVPVQLPLPLPFQSLCRATCISQHL